MNRKNEPTDYTLFDYGFITFDDDVKKYITCMKEIV